MNPNIIEKINADVMYIKTIIKSPIPTIGLILGSGLGEFVEQMEVLHCIPYAQIPNFITPTVAGHGGQLVIGKFKGTPLIVLQGRIHYYEGHSQSEIVHAVRVLGKLGVQNIVITNAAGGLNPAHRPGDFMIITDHINLMGTNPLLGKNNDELGVRFPDMTQVYLSLPYDQIIKKLEHMNIRVSKGVYGAVTGPCYETPSEVRMLRNLGLDAIGMSTVPEAIAAKHMGLKVVGISCITNLAAGLSGHELSHDEVKETANNAKSNFITLIQNILELI